LIRTPKFFFTGNNQIGLGFDRCNKIGGSFEQFLRYGGSNLGAPHPLKRRRGIFQCFRPLGEPYQRYKNGDDRPACFREIGGKGFPFRPPSGGTANCSRGKLQKLFVPLISKTGRQIRNFTSKFERTQQCASTYKFI